MFYGYLPQITLLYKNSGGTIWQGHLTVQLGWRVAEVNTLSSISLNIRLWTRVTCHRRPIQGYRKSILSARLCANREGYECNISMWPSSHQKVYVSWASKVIPPILFSGNRQYWQVLAETFLSCVWIGEIHWYETVSDWGSNTFFIKGEAIPVTRAGVNNNAHPLISWPRFPQDSSTPVWGRPFNGVATPP